MTDATHTSETARPTPHFKKVAVGSLGKGSCGWLGMITLILSEATLFGYLLFSYFYMQLQTGRAWLPEELPGFRLSGPNTAILILSSVAVWYGERSIRRGRPGRSALGLAAGFGLGAAFVGIQIREWMDKSFTLSTDSYGSMFFTITGFHMAHVIAGLLILAALTLWTSLGLFGGERHAPIRIGALYWHFVDAVWLAVWFSLYITPHLF